LIVFGEIVTARRGAPKFGLNALTGIDGFWTNCSKLWSDTPSESLNALTGIDGFWTSHERYRGLRARTKVLTPLRALMVFGHGVTLPDLNSDTQGLNALTGIDGFWTNTVAAIPLLADLGLNALTGIDGFWTYKSMRGVKHSDIRS